MAKTLQDFVDEVDALFPNQFTDAQKVNWLNNFQHQYFEWLTKEAVYEFTTVSSQEAYALPSTDVTFDLINSLYISESTVATISSTSVLQQYSLVGRDNYKAAYCFFQDEEEFSLYPIPTAEYPGKMYYQARPTEFASTTMTATFNINEDWMDVLLFKVVSRCAQTGLFPNIDLANNYELQAAEVIKQCKQKKAKQKAQNPVKRWSWGGYA